MSKRGIWGTVRQLWSEFSSHGKPELESLKQQAEALSKEVEVLKAANARNKARKQEVLALMQEYTQAIKMVGMVKGETEKKAELMAERICAQIAAEESISEREKILRNVMGSVTEEKT